MFENTSENFPTKMFENLPKIFRNFRKDFWGYSKTFGKSSEIIGTLENVGTQTFPVAVIITENTS